MSTYCKCVTGYRKRPAGDSDIEVWDYCILLCLKKLDASTDVGQSIQMEVRDAAGQYSECTQCSKRLQRKVDEVKAAWSSSRAMIEFVRAFASLALVGRSRADWSEFVSSDALNFREGMASGDRRF